MKSKKTFNLPYCIVVIYGIVAIGCFLMASYYLFIKGNVVGTTIMILVGCIMIFVIPLIYWLISSLIKILMDRITYMVKGGMILRKCKSFMEKEPSQGEKIN